jgi:hypothetical protein
LSSVGADAVGADCLALGQGDCLVRTVIQIAADPSYLYALCDDGEIFRLVNHVWQPMAPIPQDDPRDTGAKPNLDLFRSPMSPAVEAPPARPIRLRQLDIAVDLKFEIDTADRNNSFHRQRVAAF